MSGALPRYQRGNVVIVAMTFDNADGPVDPDDIFMTVSHGGQATPYRLSDDPTVIVKDGVGRYHSDVTADAAGMWHVRIEGTGAAQSATEVAWIVPTDVFS